MKNFLLLSIAVVAAFLFKVAVNKYDDKKFEASIEESEVKISPKKKREPASITLGKKPQPSQSENRSGIRESTRNSGDNYRPGEEAVENFDDLNPISQENFAGSSASGPSSNGSIQPSGPRSARSNSNSSSNASGAKTAGTTSSTSSKALGPFPGPMIPFTPPKTPSKVSDTNADAGTTTSSGGSSTSSSISCSANVGGGAFTNPISVAINCTSSATIKYCLSSNGTCCDPETSGTTYSTNLIIGSHDGNYCLSFSGTNSSGRVSTVVQQTYVINNELPDLVSTHEKIFYQTTELEGETNIASDDFGKMNYGVGVLNLYSNDPGPSGLDQTCDEVVTNYVTYPAPTPISILNYFDTSGVAASSQLDIPLRLDQLQYGDNFITTYIKDTNNAAAVYSCSTSKVKLEDFDYFQAMIAHGDTGTNSVREFSGGFTSYGFFEEETVVYRGPAGTSTEDSGGQKLETGLFCVFY